MLIGLQIVLEHLVIGLIILLDNVFHHHNTKNFSPLIRIHISHHGCNPIGLRSDITSSRRKFMAHELQILLHSCSIKVLREYVCANKIALDFNNFKGTVVDHLLHPQLRHVEVSDLPQPSSCSHGFSSARIRQKTDAHLHAEIGHQSLYAKRN